MAQSRLGSLVETLTNTALGFLFSYSIQITLNWAYDVEMSNTTAGWFVFWFTVASVLRGFIVRRVFEWYEVRKKAVNQALSRLWFNFRRWFTEPAVQNLRGLWSQISVGLRQGASASSVKIRRQNVRGNGED